MNDAKKPILVLDFDGVLNSYTSGWKGADVIPDPPVPGAIRFLLDASRVFTVTIYSSRSKTEAGRVAMRNYIEAHAAAELEQWEQVQELMTALLFASEKPPAFLTIDDRAITFTGTWPDIVTLLAFKPWNKK